MPTDLEWQLPRFAEVLDREAPAISVEEILGRGVLAIDVEASTELAATVASLPTRRHIPLKVALAAAAVVVLAFALAAVERVRQERGPANVPAPTVPAPPPVLPTSGAMWPQSTPDEVRVAQELADAGDPDYTWQVDARLVDDEYWSHLVGSGQVELVDRFLREVLGWDAYVFNTAHEGDRNTASNKLTDQRFLRCAPGRTNPLYPDQRGSEQPAGSCAPTIDDLHFESVSLDLAQLGRLGRSGIWVVNEWRMTTPFEQADPAVVENVAIGRVAEFLKARVAGTGAEGHVQVNPDVDVPLLYATTAGAPYERYEIERVGAPTWPDGYMTLAARLFADGDATVVEQKITWSPGNEPWLDIHSTSENGQPIELSYTSSDGEVTVAAPSTWEAWLAGQMDVPVVDGDVLHENALKVWTASVWRAGESFGSGERIELVDPAAYDAWCAANGGSPLLTAPADAASIVQQLIADPNFVTTAPVPARIGGVDAVSVDVSLAPGGEPCGVGMIEISRWIHTIAWEPGWRMRLYLVDLPVGMSVPTLAITVVAPEDRFDAVIAETAPIIESIEFHPKSG